MSDTYSVDEAAALLGVSRAHAYRQAHSGWLCDGVRVLRIGTRYRVPCAALDALLSPVALVASATAALHPPMRGEAGAASGAGGGRAADNCTTSGVVAEPPLKTTPPTGPNRAGVAE